MKALYLFLGIFLVLALSNTIIASSTASDTLDDLRFESLALLGNLSSKANIGSDDIKEIHKYLNKLFKSFEKKTCSSKSSVSIGELKESFEKYSAKIRRHLSDLRHCSPENQVKASAYIEKYLSDFKEAFELDERVSQVDDMFIEALRRYPKGSIASHYAELWDTINGLESQKLSSQELLIYIDSAVLSFSREFVDSNHREFATEIADDVIAPCMIGGMCETFNKAMDRLSDLQSNSSDKKLKSEDSSDEEESRKIES